MRKAYRRGLFQIAALAAASLVAACASGVSPAASPDLTDTVIIPAPPSPTAQVAPSSQPEPPVLDSTWEREWEEVIAAASREGKLSLITWGDSMYDEVIDGFQQAFPGISVDRLAEDSAAVWLGKVRQGRAAGDFAYDLALVQPDWAIKEGEPDGMWAPLRPLLFRPDVVDNSVWRDGLAGRFLDTGGILAFDWEYQVQHAYAVNTDMVNEGEIEAVTDLLDPKWRGRILTSDPRIGSGLFSASSVAFNRGTEVVRRLLVDQQPRISAGGSDLAEALIRGRNPIVMGLRPKALQPFRDQGLADKVKYLDLPDADFVASISMLYFDRAPHPAAAKLFANWVLTREGQTLLTRGIRTNSARTDVQAFEPDATGTDGKTYFDPDKEENYESIDDTQRLVRGLMRTAP